MIDLAEKVGGNLAKSEDYQECDVAVIFGSWKKQPKKKWKIFDDLCWINNLPNDLR